MEGATTASILASAAALVTIFLVRIDVLSTTAGWICGIASASLILIGALVMGLRRLDEEVVARRIDRASNLSDRLSTALAFSGQPLDDDEETRDLQLAAIRDGVNAVSRANITAAAPYVAPRDARVAGGFLAVCALAAGLYLPRAAHDPAVYAVEPDHAPGNTEIVLRGHDLYEHLAEPARLPRDGTVYLGERPMQILDWQADSIRVLVPKDAQIGDTRITVYASGKQSGQVAFGVVRIDDVRFHKENSVALDADEKAYVQSIIAELKNVAMREKVPELEDFAKKIEKMLQDAEEGKLTKEQLLEALQQAEEALAKNAEPKESEVKAKMADMGKELQKDQLTKPLGEALEKNDLEKAKQELEKLADKMDQKTLDQAKEDLKKELNDPKKTDAEKQELQKKLDELNKEKPLDDKQKQDLQKKLDDVARQMDKQDKQDQKKTDEQQQAMEKEIKRLEKKKDEAKTEQEKLQAERQLQKKKDELQQLKKDDENKQNSAQRQALKRLTRDMEKASESLQKPQKSESKEEQEQREQQASQKIKDAARETGKVDQDQRKQASQKKMSSQMDDLREAMRRAKQKGNKGPNDPFNKQAKNENFGQRARGQKGQGQGAWKPGQGQQPGQGQGQGQGQDQQGGNEPGTEHDPNSLVGDPTNKSGNTKDQDLQGQQSGAGSSKRETILAAAQKGFASTSYQKVYTDYQRIVEEVMRTEKLPSSYKYYVKRYFAKIHPSMEPAPAPSSEEPQK